MEENNIVELAGRDTVSDPLTALLRNGARKLLQTAVEAELETFLAGFADSRTPDGRAAVVRNGHHPERAVQTHCPAGDCAAICREGMPPNLARHL